MTYRETAISRFSSRFWPGGRRVSIRTAWERRTFTTVVVLAILLVAARLALPYAIQRYVNGTLDRVPEYDGRIGEVTVHLFRGAYRILDVRIVKTTGKVPVPLFSAAAIDLSVEWEALFEGKLVGEVIVEQGQLNFVNGESRATSQTKVDEEWLGVVKDLFPLRLNRVELVDSEIHFRDFDSEPPIDVRLDQLFGVGTNFTNTRSPSEGLVAAIDVQARAQKSGNFVIHAKLHPSAREPTFDLDARLTDLPLVELNDFLREYAQLDAEGGTAGFYVEMAAKEGRVSGYVKPILKDLEVVSLEDVSENPLRAVWEGIASFFATIFTNPSKEQVASRIPFEGEIGGPEVGVWSSIGSLLRNAFIKALSPQVEGSVDLESVGPSRSRD